MGHPNRRNSLTDRMRLRYKLDSDISDEMIAICKPDSPPPPNIYQLIEEKEKDLVLAAELGKALLDKNEEISHRREMITLDYTQKLEALSQDKYLLTRQLERLEDEQQQEVAELQAEVEKLRRNVEKQKRRRGAWDRDISDRVEQLSQENLRLAQEVRRKAEEERRLVSHRTDFTSELSSEKVAVAEHCQRIEELNKTITELHRAKSRLDEEISGVMKTIENLTTSASHSSKKEAALERKIKLQDNMIRELERDCEKLQNHNLQAFSRLEKVSLTLVAGSPEQSKLRTLMQEMENTEQKNDCLDGHNGEDEDEQISITTEDPFNDDKDQSELQEEETEIDQLKNEVLSVYEQVRNLISNLRAARIQGRQSVVSLHTSIASSDSSDHLASHFKVSHLTSLLTDLESLIEKKLSYKCEGDEAEISCYQRKIDLEVDLHQTKLAFEQAEKRLKQVETESKQKLDRLQQLRSKLCLMTTSLTAVREERDMLAADILETETSKEVIITKACSKRDEAVEAKNHSEVELAKNRIELLQVNSQLLETVEHKIKLSQELEEAEVSMVSQIQEQVQDKLTRAEGEVSSESSSDSDSGREKLARKLSRIIFGK